MDVVRTFGMIEDAVKPIRSACNVRQNEFGLDSDLFSL